MARCRGKSCRLSRYHARAAELVVHETTDFLRLTHPGIPRRASQRPSAAAQRTRGAPSAVAPCWAKAEIHRHAGISLEDRPEVFELFKEMPDIALGSIHAVRVQIRKGWVITVAVECLLGGPLNDD